MAFLRDPVVTERAADVSVSQQDDPIIFVLRDATIGDYTSLGFKFLTSAGVSIITNVIWPLNRAELRPNVVWTAALEYGF